MNNILNCPDILTVPEVAEILRLDLPTMDGLLSAGQIAHIEIAGKSLICKAFLENFLEKCCQKCYNNDVENSGFIAPFQGPPHLDNCIAQLDFLPFSEGDTEMATKSKINQPIIINGEKRWITANTMQEFTDKVIKLTGGTQAGKHLFADYAWNWYNTYSKPNVETATATTYKRQLTLHLCPAFDGLAVEDITTDDVQRLFNGMAGAKTTKDKARMVLNQIMDAAVEDKLITQNPVKSRRVKITGKASKATPPYSVEQMRFLVQHIVDIRNPSDRAFLALMVLHPLRLEEALGLRHEDIDTEDMAISICRAVTHPTRNQPEIKETKTEASARTIGLSALALPHLADTSSDGYLFGGDKPLSQMQVRRMLNRIKRDTGFSENITPRRFRTTVLTDLYDQTKDIKLTQAAAGHTTPTMTLKHYVKGRETSYQATAAVERAYSA